MEATSKAPDGVVGDREIVITRNIAALRERVWKAFTTAEALARWWGPNGFTITTSSFDFREGGEWVFIMHGPDGRDYPNWVRFTRIEEPSRMDHDHGGDGDRVLFRAVLTLDEVGGKTRVTLHSTFETKEQRDLVVKEYGAVEGGQQTLARLDAYLNR
ncbi:MAG: SRPBCC family protein [Flavobacteriales bacterium]|nr:SRPBCC family protein [Flavobacteriales bacterium]